MKIHPRAKYVATAKRELQNDLHEWLQRYELSTAEELLIISEVLGSAVTGTLRFVVREELNTGGSDE